MRGWLGSALAAALLAGLSGIALACDASRVQYKDNFDSMDLLWGLPTDIKKVENGEFIFSLDAGTLDFAVNQFEKFEDVDICVTTTWRAGTTAEETWAGLVFWAQDDQNLYAFGVSPKGTISIWRLIDNKWFNPLRWAAHEAVKTGPGAVNKVRVKTNGDIATFFINDVKVGSMRGVPPEGSFVGVIAEALDRSEPVKHGFDEFVVALSIPEDSPEADTPQAGAAPEPAPAPAPAPAAAPAPAPAADAPAPAPAADAPAPAPAAVPSPEAVPSDPAEQQGVQAPAPAEPKPAAETQQPNPDPAAPDGAPKPAEAPKADAPKPAGAPPAAPGP